MAATMALDEARRLAVAAQGFDRARPKGVVNRGHLRRLVQSLGAIQLDFVDVVVPAHYVVPFSRLGPYDRDLLGDLLYRRRDLTEQWAHQSSIVPVEHWALLRDGRAKHDRRVRALSAFAEKHPDYVARVLEEVRAHGPLGAADIPLMEHAPPYPRDAWGWTLPKIALEALLVQGVVAVAGRVDDQSRVFNLAERVIPKKHLRRAGKPDEAVRVLLLQAARALGVGTAGDLADVYGLPAQVTKRHLSALVRKRALEKVRVGNWREPAYRHPEVAEPTRLRAAALLAPFDPLLWSRRRVARLFEFEYVLEIFVPRAKRRWGTYVLPFLMGDQLVARVDLHTDRKNGCLEVVAAFLERGADGLAVSDALATELWAMAEWLGLDDVSVGRRGSLVVPLAKAVQR